MRVVTKSMIQTIDYIQDRIFNRVPIDDLDRDTIMAICSFARLTLDFVGLCPTCQDQVVLHGSGDGLCLACQVKYERLYIGGGTV